MNTDQLAQPNQGEQAALLSAAFFYDGFAERLVEAKLRGEVFADPVFHSIYMLIGDAWREQNRPVLLSHISVADRAVSLIAQLTNREESYCRSLWDQLVLQAPEGPKTVGSLISRFRIYQDYVALQETARRASVVAAGVASGEVSLEAAIRSLEEYGRGLNALRSSSGAGTSPERITELAPDIGKAEGRFISTGFPDWDQLIGKGTSLGFTIGSLNTISAPTGTGKSALCLGLVRKMCFQAFVPTTYINYEVSEREFTNLLFSGVIGVSSHARDAYLRGVSHIHGPKKSQEYWRALTAEFDRCLGNMVRKNVFCMMNQMAFTMDEIASTIETRARLGSVVFFIDTINRVETDSRRGNVTEDMQRTLKQLESLALSLDIIIIISAQENREKRLRADHRPRLSDISGSSWVEHLSHVVAQLYRSDLGGEANVDYSEVYINKSRGRGLQRNAKLRVQYSENHQCYVPFGEDGVDQGRPGAANLPSAGAHAYDASAVAMPPG